MSTGKTKEQVLQTFMDTAGFVGDLHTNDGVQRLYSIQAPAHFGELIYANDTAALRQAYEDAHYKGADGLFYRNEQDYATANYVNGEKA